MDYRQLIIVASLAFSGAVNAGYAQLSPPTTWSVGAAGANFYRPAANEVFTSSSTVRTNASLNVGGQAIKVPVGMRLAANSSTFLAGRIGRGLISGLGGPLGLGVTLASALVLPSLTEWISHTDYRWDPDKRVFVKNVPVSDTRRVFTEDGINWFSSISAAAAAYISKMNSQGYCNGDGQCETYTLTSVIPLSDGFSGTVYYRVWYMGSAQNGTRSIRSEIRNYDGTQELEANYDTEVKPALENVPLSWKVPNDINLPWPVDQPVINPSPAMQPQPLFVPTGNPIPNPNYDPLSPSSPVNQPFYQPGVRIVPAPVPGNPWRVDLIPVDRPVPTADPMPGPENETSPNPDDKIKPEDPKGMCDLYPEILACQVLKDSGEKPTLETKEQDFDFAPESGFNGSSSCPPPIVVNASGMSLSFSMQPFCDSLGLAKPIILAFAWLSAAFIMLGGRNS